MLLTEYDEKKTLEAERYVGRRAGYAEAQAEYQEELAAKDAEIARLKAELAAATQR